jgi:tRNA(fMet)-specific endonuclease VapC
MSGKFLLDTNILIALFSGDTSVQVHLKNADEVFISSTVLGELYFGARKSHHVKKNLAHIDEFASNITVLSCDSNTARKYGLIKNSLLEKGKPIPENDIWIAAVAQQHSLVLISRDNHFSEVENLESEKW